MRVPEFVDIGRANGCGSFTFAGHHRFGELTDFDGIDDLASLRKKVKKVGKKIKRIGKKALPKLKKSFVKVAPILGIAAQALNLVVPGLGVAVGLAISAGAGALAARDAKKAAQEAEKTAEREEAAAAAEEAKIAEEIERQLGPEAEQKTMEAYLKGESYFTRKYGMTREKFASLPLPERMRFFMATIYDQHEPRFRAKGVSRDGFLAMSLAEQQRLLEVLHAEAPLYSEGFPLTTILLVGVGIIIAVTYLLAWKKRE